MIVDDDNATHRLENLRCFLMLYFNDKSLCKIRVIVRIFFIIILLLSICAGFTRIRFDNYHNTE